MDLTIKVVIGVTPELKALAESLLGSRKAPAPEGESKENKAKAAKAVKTESKPAEPVPAEAVVTEKKAEPEAPAKATYTEEDVREAMHKCRLRIEGADYKENTSSEGYTKYHKNLTQMFKNISARLGYDKPSELPVELRKAFIDECADIIIGEDGLLTSVPF